VIAEGDLIKLFEYDPAGKKFNLIWESAETGTGIKSLSFGINGMVLEDLDRDGQNELVAIDQFGIFVWEKNGKVPIYYNLKDAVVRSGGSYVLLVDLDSDGVFEFVTQRNLSLGYSERQVEAWKIQGDELSKLSEIELPGGTSWSLREGDCDNDKIADIITSASLIHVLGWKKDFGFIGKAAFPNNSNLVDVLR